MNLEDIALDVKTITSYYREEVYYVSSSGIRKIAGRLFHRKDFEGDESKDYYGIELTKEQFDELLAAKDGL